MARPREFNIDHALDQALQAFERLRQGEQMGKLVIEVAQ